MEDLIAALLIFSKYRNERCPTHCEHDILMIMGIEEDELSVEHATKVEELGFHWSSEYACWTSYRFGSS
jgi:hypothetical protein